MVAASGANVSTSRPAVKDTFLGRLNSTGHKHALWIFGFIVLAHWAEHLAQATQIYVMGWKPPEARGVLGLFFPWLVKSETLHYGYALVMLIGLWMLRSGFRGRAYTWWMVAFWIQFWHHIEHALLQGQALFQHNLNGSPVPLSMLQFFVPRVELHLFYNTIVFIPMVIAMYLHVFPLASEEAQHDCDCAWHPQPATRTA